MPTRGLLSLTGPLLAGLLAGCTLNPPLELSALSGDRSRHVEGVPFFPQAEFECGPAALAGLLGASGLDARPDELAPRVYLPGRRGSLQLELVAATRRSGRIPYVLEPHPEALLAQLQSGRPVLVLQNLGTPGLPVWHYAVLTGFDAPRNLVYLNTGVESARPMPAPAFLRTWDWAQRWALVALRPGELPAGVEIAGYTAAVADFEAVAGAEAALPAWRAALRQWPRDYRPYLALGNGAYASGELLVAAVYYRRGLALDEHNPALSNNLASVLGELGCARAGEQLLAPVLASLPGDSPWRGPMEATLVELGSSIPAAGGFCTGLP